MDWQFYLVPDWDCNLSSKSIQIIKNLFCRKTFCSPQKLGSGIDKGCFLIRLWKIMREV